MHHNHKDFSFMDPTPEILLHALFKQVSSSLLLNRVCVFLLVIPAKCSVPGCAILVRLVCWWTAISHVVQEKAQATFHSSKAQLLFRVLKMSVKGITMKNLS